MKSMREDEASAKIEETAVATDTISITNGGLSNQIISVDSPAKVTFVNEDNKAHQIASDPHPTHSDLPNLNSGILYRGESFSLVIVVAGEYKFHLEDNPSVGGKIIVN
jgi:plastocyanin